ncbi:MAG: PEP-CTERM sorting domain-containing protein [Candidatus Auribacterota bacterium]|nr:PEP-CTERM sorting domain-containing protein [Candidatus Auribacterota bacterium]
MRRTIWLVLALISLLGCYRSVAYGIPCDIYLYNTQPLVDQFGDKLDGTTLDAGLVQVIWTGLDGIINPFDDQYAPTGDDIILCDANGVQVGVSQVGAGYPVGFGDGYVSVAIQNIDCTNYCSGSIYLRIFNTSDPLNYEGEVFWIDSHPFTMQDIFSSPASSPEWGLGFYQFSFGDSFIIPEPATVLLLCGGALAVWFKKRRSC